MFSDLLKNTGEFVYNFEPVNQFINGVVLMARSVSFFVFLPMKILGIELIPAITNIIYLGIIFYILMKMLNSKKWAGVVLIAMILIGSFGGF
ncbi:MAG: hypothetical protein ACTSQ8_19170 [Candidatus Helarchaeota archaeon]